MRNPIDLLNATAGMLLRFQVPEVSGGVEEEKEEEERKEGRCGEEGRKV